MQQLRQLMMQNPALIQPLIQQLAAQNPAIAQAISQNPEALYQILSGEEGEDDEEGMPQMGTRIEVTEEEQAAIQRVRTRLSPLSRR